MGIFELVIFELVIKKSIMMPDVDFGRSRCTHASNVPQACGEFNVLYEKNASLGGNVRAWRGYQRETAIKSLCHQEGDRLRFVSVHWKNPFPSFFEQLEPCLFLCPLPCHRPWPLPALQ